MLYVVAALFALIGLILQWFAIGNISSLADSRHYSLFPICFGSIGFQLLSVFILVCAGLEVISSSQGFSLLLFIALNYGISSVWGFYWRYTRSHTEFKPVLMIRYLWLLQAVVAVLVFCAVLLAEMKLFN